MPEIKSPLQNIQAMFLLLFCLFVNKKEKTLSHRQCGYVKSPLSSTATPLSGKIRIIVLEMWAI